MYGINFDQYGIPRHDLQTHVRKSERKKANRFFHTKN